jgi:hypothetical protein
MCKALDSISSMTKTTNKQIQTQEVCSTGRSRNQKTKRMDYSNTKKDKLKGKKVARQKKI